MVFYAPTVNSYKRYVDASWAPTRLAWSHDNRTAGFRVVGAGPSLRIECRIPGADCNPYLAFAAVARLRASTASRNKIEPPDAFVGDIYQAERPAARAVHAARSHRPVREQRVRARRPSAQDVVEHYAHFYRTEAAAYDKAVTDWERRRYFETDMRLKDKVALITGAGSGIGRQSALLFAKKAPRSLSRRRQREGGARNRLR